MRPQEIEQRGIMNDEFMGTHTLSDNLCKTLARSATPSRMAVEEVRRILQSGRSVWTRTCYYRLKEK